MFNGQLAFADALGPDAGINGDFVERIVELEQPRHGRRLPFAATPNAEVLFDIGRVGQFGCGAVDSQKLKAVPGFQAESE